MGPCKTEVFLFLKMFNLKQEDQIPNFRNNLGKKANSNTKTKDYTPINLLI